MAQQEQKEFSEAELWKKVPFETQVEVDMAIDHGDKPLAANYLMCAKVGFTLLTAKKFIEQRKRDMPKRITNKKI